MSAIAPGSKLSHFEILEKLGEGGMGVVYKARDLRLDRLVAIKVLPEKAVANAEREARFVQEAKAASALNHPNIITVYEIDTMDGAIFIAMEYVDGRTLDQVIPRKGLRFTEALKYAVQITDALASAHHIGIIHRDLKPANIIVTAKGLVKVLDFGLAKLLPVIGQEMATASMTPSISEPGSIMGTVAYMSPEQAQGKPVDARSDIFSFGIVLYEMLTGRRPFIGDNKISTLAAIVNTEPTPARQIIEDLPHDLDRILARCLRKDPARRFQGMADLHVALEELKEESDSGKLAVRALPKRQHRPTWLWVSLAALALLAISGAWIAKRFATPSPSPRVVAVTTFAGSEQQPSFSPDGNQVAFSWDGEKGGNFDIYVKLLGETNALRLTTDAAVDRFPAWSPDGKRIAFQRVPASGPAGVYVTSPLGGVEQKIADFAAEGQMSWSPDGKWLAASMATAGSGIVLVPIDGGELRPITHPKAPGFDSAPSISPTGRLLAYAACTGALSCDVYIQKLDAAYGPQGAPYQVTHHDTPIRGLAWSRDEASLIYDGPLGSLDVWYLWRVNVHDQRPPQRLEIAGANARFPAMAATGDRLAYTRFLQDYDIWRYHVGGGTEPLLVSSMADTTPAYSPDGNRIAFESNRSGDTSEIWVARADGSGLVQMTNHLGRHQGSPRWSPDDHWIAFDSEGQNRRGDIYVMDASGGRPRRVTSDPSNDDDPDWSPDGKWIYFVSDRSGRKEVWRVPFAGGPFEQITQDGAFCAHLSVDGKTLFYIKAWSSPLFAKPLAGGPERLVLPYVSNLSFDVVEDGIYYVGRRSDDGQYPIQFYEFSRNSSRMLTKIDGAVFTGISVSPDRKTILFSKSVTSGADLMMIENFQ